MSSQHKTDKPLTRVERHRRLKVFMILSMIFALISLITLGLFSYSLISTNIVPVKYLGIIYGIIGIIYLILFVIFFKKKCPKTLKVLSYIFSVFISVVFVIGSLYLNNTNKLFKDIQVAEYETISYSVITLKDNEYESIEDLNGKTIAYLNDSEKNKVIKNLNKKIEYQEVLGTIPTELEEKLMAHQIDAICLEQGYLSMLDGLIDNFEASTKVIHTFEVKIKSHKESNKKIDVSKEPFIVYISGIDRFGNVNSVRGRSDVNQLAVINPKKHKILLLNTPRDYYVQLHDTVGLKDKLTHAGVYGISKSIETLEDIYNIDINYYFRVNFDTLILMVDTVGGVEVYSDTDLVLFHDKNYHVKVGMNRMNGKEALAYARERYGYTNGDIHRGQNQQAIITALIGKLTDPEILINKYNDILSTLGSSFQTDMPKDTITSFLRRQLNEMPSWKIETYTVEGSGDNNYTYSLGSNIKTYVMIPNEETIKTAKQKIKEVMKGA